LSPSSTSVTSPNASVEDNKESDDENDHESNNGADRLANTPSSTATFGEAAKVKVPGVKETKGKTKEDIEKDKHNNLVHL
jgi:hypothetical protein